MSKNTDFEIKRTKITKDFFSGDVSLRRRLNQESRNGILKYNNSSEVIDALNKAASNPAARNKIAKESSELYNTNPIYTSLIDYLANMYYWRYTVIPHQVFTKSKAKAKKIIPEDDFKQIYHSMLEVVEGLHLETKIPLMLTQLYISGAVFFTTILDEETLSIDTITLPEGYCRKIGETQYGTSIIQFDYNYFKDIGGNESTQKELMKLFPKEMQGQYKKYLNNNDLRWQTLDPRYSSGILLNEKSIPSYFYILGSLLDFESYKQNELQRNSNLLKYVLVHNIPVYQDRLVFSIEEAKALQASLREIFGKNDNVKVVTTYGDAKVEKIGDSTSNENNILPKAFESIFHSAGFNSGLFTGDSVTALNMSLIRDKGIVWKHVQAISSFYNITINNWIEYKNYQAEIEILPISPYTYNDDIKVYKDNATLGVNKLAYFVASGIKQKNLEDQLKLEALLGLNDIKPMQTSYTQTAEDRIEDDKGLNKKSEQSETGIEPSVEEKTDK